MELRITVPEESTKAAWGTRAGQNSMKIVGANIEPLFYKEEGDHDVAYLEVVVKNGNKELSVHRAVLVIQGKDGKMRLRSVSSPKAVPKFEKELMELLATGKSEQLSEDDSQEDVENDVAGEPEVEPLVSAAK